MTSTFYEETIVRSTIGGSQFLVESNPLPTGTLEAINLHNPITRKNTTEENSLTDLQFSSTTVFDIRIGSEESLRSRVSSFQKDADFEKVFLESIVLITTHVDAIFPLKEDDKAFLRDLGCHSLHYLSPNSYSEIPQGPYFVHRRRIHRTWKLFPDVYEAFQCPTIQTYDNDT